MELNITRFFNECAPMDYSASIAELGQSAGADTWRAANDDSAEYMLLDNEAKRDAFRSFVKSSGGWNADEISAWSDIELNALCIQWIAGDIRESFYLDFKPIDWNAYKNAENEIHRIFKGIDNEIYFYIGE